MTQFVQPPALRTFLEYGGDPRSVLGDEEFTYLLEDHQAAEILPRSRREQRATNWRSLAAGEPVENATPRSDDPATWFPIKPARHQEEATRLAWAADVLEDPALGDRLYEFLSTEQQHEQGLRRDQNRQPHPFAIGIPETDWCCMNCGTAFEHAEAVAFQPQHREGWSELAEYAVTYCTPCIVAAAGEMQSR